MSKKAHHFKEVLTQLIVEIFQKSGQQLLNPKQVSAKLKLDDADARETIAEILRNEVRKGTLREPERGRFQLKELKTFVTGRVDLTTDGSAFIITEDEFEADIQRKPFNKSFDTGKAFIEVSIAYIQIAQTYRFH